MQKEIDFTNSERVMGRAYNGANGKKIAIMHEEKQYMLKFPPSAENKPTELSYINSCVSEHIACSIFNMLGVKAQNTILGTFEVVGKAKIVCACEDFTVDGKVLYDFCSIKNTVIDSEHNGTGTELADVLETIQKQQFVLPNELTEHFWKVFIIDALLGNFDRHNGNWGFLYDPITQKSEIAPIYDCGSCLLPQADEKVKNKILSDINELNARIFQFPTSAIKENGVKINYYNFIMNTQNEDCRKALVDIVEKFEIDKINDFIDEVPYINELDKKFYRKYIHERYEKILYPVYENIMLL